MRRCPLLEARYHALPGWCGDEASLQLLPIVSLLVDADLDGTLDVPDAAALCAADELLGVLSKRCAVAAGAAPAAILDAAEEVAAGAPASILDVADAAAAARAAARPMEASDLFEIVHGALAAARRAAAAAVAAIEALIESGAAASPLHVRRLTRGMRLPAAMPPPPLPDRLALATEEMRTRLSDTTRAPRTVRAGRDRVGGGRRRPWLSEMELLDALTAEEALMADVLVPPTAPLPADCAAAPPPRARPPRRAPPRTARWSSAFPLAASAAARASTSPTMTLSSRARAASLPASVRASTRRATSRSGYPVTKRNPVTTAALPRAQRLASGGVAAARRAAEAAAAVGRELALWVHGLLAAGDFEKLDAVVTDLDVLMAARAVASPVLPRFLSQAIEAVEAAEGGGDQSAADGVSDPPLASTGCKHGRRHALQAAGSPIPRRRRRSPAVRRRRWRRGRRRKTAHRRHPRHRRAVALLRQAVPRRADVHRGAQHAADLHAHARRRGAATTGSTRRRAARRQWIRSPAAAGAGGAAPRPARRCSASSIA